MTNTYDLIYKLLGPIQVSIYATTNVPRDIPFNSMLESLQLAYYWWLDACKYQEREESGEDTIEEAKMETVKIIVPPLHNVQEALGYLDVELGQLMEESEKFIEESGFSPSVTSRLRNGADRVIEGYFYVKICKNYHEQYERTHPHG